MHSAPGADEFSAGGSAAFVSAILWLRVFWASASVIGVAGVPRWRWLLTSGLISLVFLIFFLAVPSRPLRHGGPRGIVVWSPIHMLSHWSTLSSCTPVVGTLHHFSLHGRAGVLGKGGPRCGGGGGRCGARASGALSVPTPRPTPTAPPVLRGQLRGGPCHVGRFRSGTVTARFLPSPGPRRACSSVRPQSLHLPHRKVLPGFFRAVFLGVPPGEEATLVSYTEPFYCSQNLRCEAARAASPCAWAPRGVSSAEGGAAGCCWVSSLRPMVAVMVTRVGCASSRCGGNQASGGGATQGLWDVLSAPTTNQTSHFLR